MIFLKGYMANTIVIDIVEQPFHSAEDFANIWSKYILHDSIRAYLRQYIILAPGDYHAQRHARDCIRYTMWKARQHYLVENDIPDPRALELIDHIIPLNGMLHASL